MKKYLAICIVCLNLGCSHSTTPGSRPSPSARVEGPSLRQSQEAYAQGRFQESVKALDAVIQADPTRAEPYLWRGRAYFALNLPVIALKDFEAVLKIEPENAQALYSRGVVHSLMHHDKEALADFTRSISLDAKFADNYRQRAEVYQRLGQKDKARDDLDQCKKMGPPQSPVGAEKAP